MDFRENANDVIAKGHLRTVADRESEFGPPCIHDTLCQFQYANRITERLSGRSI